MWAILKWPVYIWHFKIGYFRVVLYLVFKASRGALPFRMKMSFHSHEDNTRFHMKGFAQGLALKTRHKTIREWPIWNYTRNRIGNLA